MEHWIYNVINKQVILQIIKVNKTFYMYGNIRLKEKSILSSFKQIDENYISPGFFGSARYSQIPDRHDNSADRHTHSSVDWFQLKYL